MGGGIVLNSLFGGHARFASLSVCIGSTYLFLSERKKRDLWICFLMYSVGLLSTRSKMFGFYAAAIAVFFIWNLKGTKRIKIFNIKTIVIAFAGIVGILYAAKDKIFFYFVEGYNATYMFARPLLYTKALEILKDFPLLGTGFGSYATDASAVYYSPLYYDYELYLSPEIGQGLFISDTWFPVLAQFGYIGIVLIILFWRDVYTKAKYKFQMTKNPIDFKMAILIMIFFFIESVADSTFTQNRGMYMMMLLGLCVRCSVTDLSGTDTQLLKTKRLN